MKTELDIRKYAILAAIEDKAMPQREIAHLYCGLLRDFPAEELIEAELIKPVNMAIIKRWSVSGLNRIKTLAWQQYENKGPWQTR